SRGDGYGARRKRQRLELSREVRGDRAHSVDARRLLGVAVVVGVRVDVVRVQVAVAVGDEFDPCDADAVVAEETPIALDDRMPEALDETKAARRRRHLQLP